MSELDDLGLKHNCDKSSRDRRRDLSAPEGSQTPGHDYLRKYEFFMSRFRDKDTHLLELGIGPDWNMGASLKIWQDYFTSAGTRFTISDINPNARDFASDKVTIEVGDLGERAFLQSLAAGRYDVIIDDASHFWDHQIIGFEALFPAVTEGGVYIIEDIQTSFAPARRKYANGSSRDAYEYFSTLASLVTGGGNAHPINENAQSREALLGYARQIDSVTFIRHSCIICKAGYYK